MVRKCQMESEEMYQTYTFTPLPRISHCYPKGALRQSLPSELAAISPFTDQLMLFIHKFREADGSEVDIEIALREALANAVVHGNHEDSHRRVYLTCCCNTDGEVSITVCDEGRGFDDRAVPDPTAPRNVEFTADSNSHSRGSLRVQ